MYFQAICTVIMNLLVLLLTSNLSYFSVTGQISSCAIGRSSSLQNYLQISTSEAWQLLDLSHPASCDGAIAGLFYCYTSVSHATQHPSQVIIRIWRRFVKDMSTLRIVNEFALQLSTNGSETRTTCSNETLKESLKFEQGDVIGFLFPPNFAVGLAFVNDSPTEGLYRDKRSVKDYNLQLSPSSDLAFETNLTLNIQINVLPSALSGIFKLISTTTSMVQSSLHQTTSIATLNTTLPQPTIAVKSVVLGTNKFMDGVTSIKVVPLPTNPSTIQEFLVGSVELQTTPSTLLKVNLNTLSHSEYDALNLQSLTPSLQPLIIMTTSNKLPPKSILRKAPSIIDRFSMDSNLLRLSSTRVMQTSIGPTYADNSRRFNPSGDVNFSSATTSNKLYPTSTKPYIETASAFSLLIGTFDSTSMPAITRSATIAYSSIEIKVTPINMMSLSEAPEGTTLVPFQTIQGLPLAQSTWVVPPSFSTFIISSIKQKVTLDPNSKPSSSTEATTSINPLNITTTTVRIAAASILSFTPAEMDFSPSQTPIIVVQSDPQNRLYSLLEWAVAAIILFAIVTGCIMLISLYIFHYLRTSKVRVISAKRTTLGVDNLSYSMKSSYKWGSIVPILTDISTNEMTVSSDLNSRSNDNVERNSPLITTSGQQPLNNLSLPRNLVTPMTPIYNIFETEVSREKELDSIPLLLVSFSQGNCGEITASEMNDDRRHSKLSMCVHDYEELTMGKSKEQRQSHWYEEPKSDLPDRQQSASDYEKPVPHNWKRLSMPRLSMFPISDELSSPLQGMQRRNSSACDLTMHCCTAASSSHFPANRKPQKIRHYAEFSLYPLQQVTADFCLKTKQTACCKKGHSFSFGEEMQCHDYEEPFSRLPVARQLVPAPLITRRRASDYEIPMVTSPLPRPLSNMHSPVKKNNPITLSINIDHEEEEKEREEEEGEKGEEESFIKVGRDTNAKVNFSFDTSNILFTALTDQMCSPENHDSVLSCLAMDGAYLSPPSNEEDLTSKIRKLSVTMIPYAAIVSNMTTNEPEQQAVWKNDQTGCSVNVTIRSADFTNSDKLDILQDITVMAQFRHPNIVKLHGAVNDSSHTILVSEYFPRGDLRKVLVQMGRSFIPTNTPQVLLLYSQQAALGMQYLASKGFIHKDLSATNIFTTNNDICKVGGLNKSRDLSNVNQYIVNGGKIHVRWMAPEAIHNGQYSTPSDVWSYGCLLYEIWSLGRMPFRDHSNSEVIEKVDSGYRLPPPPGCPLVIYNLMMQCWNPNPFSRPSFDDIITTLLKDEDRVLKIPIKDASTHKLATILGASLTSGAYMYSDVQNKYVNKLHESRGLSFKGHDYEHIQEEKFMLAFPTSSADLACESSSSTSMRMRRDLEDSNEMLTMSEGISLVPQPTLYSEPVVLSPITSK